MRIFGLIALCAAISGCAVNLSQIPPTVVAPSVFASYDCEALAVALAEREPRLIEIAKDQRMQRSAGSTFNNLTSQQAEIGKLKGELAAIRSAGATKGCTLRPQLPALTSELDPTSK